MNPKLSTTDQAEFAEIVQELASAGYVCIPEFASPMDDGKRLVKLIHRLGEPLILPNSDPSFPITFATPTQDASASAPFNRPERIGWHSDFSTWKHRPVFSLSWIRQPDPGVYEGDSGSWLIAEARAVLNELGKTASGRKVINFLSKTPLPLAYEASDDVFWAKIIDCHPLYPDRTGIRFYRRSILEGAKKAWNAIPKEISEAVALLETSADACSRSFRSMPGALLVCDNWMALHDRTALSAGNNQHRRIAYLAFVNREAALT